MKTLITVIFVAAALLGLSLSAKAGEHSRQAYDSCVGQLQSHYGEGTQFRLVDQRRHLHGTKIRVAVRQDSDNAYFATCWVARRDGAEFARDAVDGVAELWAVTIQSAPLK